MAERKRKPAEKKFPVPKTFVPGEEQDDNDLKKEKARIMAELAENKEREKEWYDRELDKNLKNIK